MKIIHPIKVSDVIKDNYTQYCDVVLKYETVDAMWGIEKVMITDNDIKALQEGKYLYFSDDEYAHILYYGKAKEEGVKE